MCLGSLPEASLELAKADLHGICHVNDTKGIYLHGNCHVNLSCDLVLTWECHVKEPENQGFPFLTWEFHVEVPVNQGLRLPDMGIPCKWTLEPRNPPPPLGRHGNPMYPGTRKRTFTWDSTSISQDFTAGLPHMEIPCGSRHISQFAYFFHVGGLFFVAVHMGFPCKDYKKHWESTEHENSM